MSEVKVNKISPRTACGTVTLGDSGDTFTIPSGATINNQGTAVNFGATGSASWDTTPKTGDFTAVAGVGYFVNTTSGAITVTLPASPSAGDVVAVKDYANTFDTNSCTIARNGSNIGGSAINVVLSTEGLAITLVYVDATKGWLVTDSGLQSEAAQPTFITATGGTITTDSNYKVHTFTGPGTFTVCSVGNPCGSTTVDYMVVAGGGGSGATYGAAGGAGGFREGYNPGSYTASPLATTSLPVTATGYPIVVGGGGAAGPPGVANTGTNGANSSFSTITSTGGGGGSGGYPCATNALPGGSGGGAGGYPSTTGGTGNTPPVSPSQGFPGGSNTGLSQQAGGGGATAAALNTVFPSPNPVARGSVGGAGATTSINGSSTAFAGGGGGVENGGGIGGGGNGVCNPAAPTGTPGTINTGGGAGSEGNTGGSGIVIIRYKFQ